jgi:hypothetical protein
METEMLTWVYKSHMLQVDANFLDRPVDRHWIGHLQHISNIPDVN